MKKDAYYFPHDSNAKDDPKCILLVEQLGLEGYGIFWVLVEILRDQNDFKYPIKLLPSIARKFNTTFEKVKAVVFSYELFEIENESFFYSKSLIERMIPLQERKEFARLAGIASAEKRKKLKEVQQPFNGCSTVVEQPLNEGSTIRGEEIRGEEIRGEEKKIKTFKEPPLLEIENYFIENGYIKDAAKRFLNYYSCAGWIDSKGTKIRNWKQKAQAVWFKPENEIKKSGYIPNILIR